MIKVTKRINSCLFMCIVESRYMPITPCVFLHFRLEASERHPLLCVSSAGHSRFTGMGTFTSRLLFLAILQSQGRLRFLLTSIIRGIYNVLDIVSISSARLFALLHVKLSAVFAHLLS